MPSIRPHKDSWIAEVRLKGHPYKSKVHSTRARAKKWADETEKDLKAGVKPALKGTLQDAIDRYILEVCPRHRSGKNEALRLKAISKMLPASRQVVDLQAQDITAFRDKRMGEVSDHTVRKEMGILRGVFESARREWSMLDKNPMADVRRPPSPPNRHRLMAEDEIRRILLALGYVEGEKITTLSQEVAVGLQLALETAMRDSEMLGLRWADVHLKEQYVTLPRTKNGDQRDVPLSKRAVALLESMKGVDKVTVFTVTSASRDALFRKARDACKVQGLHFHDSRATALTRLSRKLDVLELARMVGHRDLKSLMVYYRKSATDIAKGLG